MSRVLVSSYRVRSRTQEDGGPVLWPRYLPGPGGQRVVRMVPIHPAQIPAGWQNVAIRVPQRLATCEEVDCPFFLGGWNEVITADGGNHPMRGDMTQDEAADKFGLYGPREIAPVLRFNPPGTPCPRIHKLPSGLPPVYSVDGRTVLWDEFEDRLGSGVERMAEIV